MTYIFYFLYIINGFRDPDNLYYSDDRASHVAADVRFYSGQFESVVGGDCDVRWRGPDVRVEG